MTSATPSPMTHREALEVLARHREGKIVVTTMTSGGIWPTLSDTPLDGRYAKSSGVSDRVGQMPPEVMVVTTILPSRWRASTSRASRWVMGDGVADVMRKPHLVVRRANR